MTLIFASLFLLSSFAFAQRDNNAIFPTLQWDESNATGCLFPGYDACATMEFCSGSSSRDSYGYRLPGETKCDLTTAPLIRMRAGRKYLLTFVNTHESQATNLHTHGLHVWGDGNGDDITRCAPPGGGQVRYTYDLIAQQHRGGTFWYHAHFHGNSFAHVKGGALGMLIVQDEVQDLPQNEPGIQEFATGLDNELLLVASAFPQRDNPVAVVFGNGMAGGPTWSLQANVWYRLRLLSAAPDARRVDVSLLSSTANCEAHHVATDGIWRSTVPGLSKSVFTVTGASRLDLAIRCTTVTSTESSEPLPSVVYAGQTVAKWQVLASTLTNTNMSLASPFDSTGSPWQSRPNLPAGHYLQDLQNAVVNDSFNVRVDRDSINGQGWNRDVYLRALEFNEIHEWGIRDSERHPFHLHIFPFQIISPGGCGHHEQGEFYDSLSSSSNDPCLIRFATADISGRVILHCHILEHEDMGSMAWVQVVNGPSPDYRYMDDGFPMDSTDDAPLDGNMTSVDSGENVSPNGDDLGENVSPNGDHAACHHTSSSLGKRGTRLLVLVTVALKLWFVL